MLTTHQFESERLYTDTLKREDAETLFEFYSDQEAMRFRGNKPMLQLKDAFKMINSHLQKEDSGSKLRLGIRSKEANELLGTLLLKVKNTSPNECEVGFSFGKNHWGKGYATATLNMVERKLTTDQTYSSLIAWCKKENKASIRVFEKNGYQVIEQTDYPDSILFRKALN